MSKTWGLAPVFLALALSGCASETNPTQPSVTAVATKVSEVRSGVIDFATADLQEASRIAHEAGDVIAYTCWDYLVTVVPETQGASNGKIDGVATAFQRARNVIKRAGDGVSTDLRLNCGPLYLDAKDDVSGIAGRIASLGARLGVKLF